MFVETPGLIYNELRDVRDHYGEAFSNFFGADPITLHGLMNLNMKYPRHKSFKVFMSGTPIASPTDVLGVLTVLHNDSWETDRHHEMYPMSTFSYRGHG